jgi:UDP-glucose 4-epimerase
VKFLVTGGTGFVGSHLVTKLVKENHSVIVIDNLYSSKLENLSSVIDRIQFNKLDILEYEKLVNIGKNIDGIFHLAALTNVQESFEKESQYQRVNVSGTENILKLAKKNGSKVVFASSASVYGNPQKIPIMEDSPKIPLNPYGQTKLQGEILCQKYSNDVEFIGLRYFNVYGTGQNLSYAGVITKFLENIRNRKPPVIYGDGKQTRDFIYVEDVAQANLNAMNSKKKGIFVNIGTGIGIPITELAETIIKISGFKLKPTYKNSIEGDIRASQAEISLAKKILGWKPQTKLNDWLAASLVEQDI